MIGQRSEFGGVTAKAFHLVDGQDDPAVRGVGLDLPGQREYRCRFSFELASLTGADLRFAIRVLCRHWSLSLT